MSTVNLEFSYKEIEENFLVIGEEFQREINRLRADPCSYIPILKNMIIEKHMDSYYFKSTEYDQFFEINEKRFQILSDSSNIIDSMISTLKKQRPVQTLSFNENISKSCSLNNDFHHLSSVNLNNKLDKYLNWENKTREIQINGILNSTDAVLYILMNKYDFVFDEEMNYIGYYMNFENQNISHYNNEQNQIKLVVILVSKLRKINESHYNRSSKQNVRNEESGTIENKNEKNETNNINDLLLESKEVKLNTCGEAYKINKKIFKTDDINCINILEEEKFYKLLK